MVSLQGLHHRCKLGCSVPSRHANSVGKGVGGGGNGWGVKE